jgi:hypothetical protein
MQPVPIEGPQSKGVIEADPVADHVREMMAKATAWQRPAFPIWKSAAECRPLMLTMLTQNLTSSDRPWNDPSKHGGLSGLRPRPLILGALLEAASHGLRTLSGVCLKQLPRMVDFALWATVRIRDRAEAHVQSDEGDPKTRKVRPAYDPSVIGRTEPVVQADLGGMDAADGVFARIFVWRR